MWHHLSSVSWLMGMGWLLLMLFLVLAGPAILNALRGPHYHGDDHHGESGHHDAHPGKDDILDA